MSTNNNSSGIAPRPQKKAHFRWAGGNNWIPPCFGGEFWCASFTTPRWRKLKLWGFAPPPQSANTRSYWWQGNKINLSSAFLACLCKTCQSQPQGLCVLLQVPKSRTAGMVCVFPALLSLSPLLTRPEQDVTSANSKQTTGKNKKKTHLFHQKGTPQLKALLAPADDEPQKGTLSRGQLYDADWKRR